MSSNKSVLSLDVNLRFEGFRLRVKEEVELKGVTSLFGPSGAGKSTLLRTIAGIESRATGSIRFAGKTWLDTAARKFIPPNQRAIGMVFQDAYLFPHLKVLGNLNYGLRRRGNRVGPNATNVSRALDLSPLQHRSISNLSGGERQRVALGRALLSAPDLLLLDEPIAALDAERKHEIVPYLKRVIHEFDLPIIYVSHSVDEVQSLADKVVLIKDGEIVNKGNIDLLDEPRLCSYIRAKVMKTIEPGTVICRVGDSLLHATTNRPQTTGCWVIISIDTTRMMLSSEMPEGAFCAGNICCRVIEFENPREERPVNVKLECAGGVFTTRVHRPKSGEPRLVKGQDAFVTLLKPPMVVGTVN